MNILSYSEARANLKKTMDAVCEDHAPTVIARQGGESVVIMSLADYESMEETLYQPFQCVKNNRLIIKGKICHDA